MVVCLGVISAPTQAAGLPLIVSATVDYTHGTLTIKGQNFGSSPTITVDSMTFPTVSSASNQIVGTFPSGTPPSSFTPGTYFLVLQSRNQLPSVFTVNIGANGPQGPAGAQGPPGAPGPQGIQGLTGARGATGAVGAPGPMGATGATGAMGATGATGAAGAIGPQGLKGDKGDPGAPGTGGITCTAPNVYLVIAYGTLACQPQYMDNGDGTVTDNSTGLMWEKKSAAGTGDVHDSNNLYTWSAAPPYTDPTGTLYSDFLQQLDGLNFVGGGPCFAGHCDWRIPSVGELMSLIPALYPACSVCTPPDPPFGPTPASYFWSSTSLAIVPVDAWNVNLLDGSVTTHPKSDAFYARAVRRGR